MARKLYSVGIHYVQRFITEEKSDINYYIVNPGYFEYAKIFGRSHYELYIQSFIEQFKINKEIDYAIKVLNHYKSYTYIYKLYKLLNLERFEERQKFATFDETTKKDYQKNIFYSFIYYLTTVHHVQREKIEHKLFTHYFLHTLVMVSPKTKTKINHKNLSLALLKGKDMKLKESFKEENGEAFFTLYINQKPHIQLTGKSIKTLSKRAYKQLFYDLIDQKI